MKAAKETTLFLVLLIASALIACAPALASSEHVLALETRAEISAESGQFSVEPSPLSPETASRYYDSVGEVASGSPLAPRGTADLPILNPHFTPDPTKIVGSQNAYSTAFRTRLPSSAFPGRSRGYHFQQANRQLIEAMDGDAAFARQMEALIPDIRQQLVNPRSYSRQPPSGWTWHHHADTGVMELVPRVQHEAAGQIQQLLHPGGQGGMNIWGR